MKKLVAILVTALFLVLPLSAEAGLIRTYFDFECDDPNVEVYGTPYVQIPSDLWGHSYGEWFDPWDHFPSFEFDLAFLDFTTEEYIGWDGQLINPYHARNGLMRINDLGGGVYTCDYTEVWIEGWMETSLNPGNPELSYLWLLGTTWRIVLADNPDDPLLIGNFSTSVWFDDPPPIPIPSAVWLLGSGLIGMLGIRRKMEK
jgi:hypothetical protein